MAHERIRQRSRGELEADLASFQSKEGESIGYFLELVEKCLEDIVADVKICVCALKAGVSIDSLLTNAFSEAYLYT